MARKRSAHITRQKSEPIETVTRSGKQPPAGTGPDSAGQSGDVQGLPGTEEENESVRELVEEGQFYEASVVDGVENAPDADEGPVRILSLIHI